MMSTTNFLETDESVKERNLRICEPKNVDEYGLNKILGSNHNNLKAPPRDYKVVQPRPGFCLKSMKINTNEKYFINVCQTECIPPPEDISEEQLAEILDSETPGDFRMPLSISEPRITKDKAGNPVDVCDIAINPKFFQKIQTSPMFNNFFLAVIAEALSDKYNVQLNMDKSIILTNRKFIGTLVSHRIRNNDVQTVLKSYQNPSQGDVEKLKQLQNSGRGSLVQELDNQELMELKSQLGASARQAKEPEYKLRLRVKGKEYKELIAEFYLPKCVTVNDFILDVGEDRIVLESTNRDYYFDKFVKFNMAQNGARAIFDKTSKMLQLRVPVFTV